MSGGTYAEPGTQTIRENGRRELVTAECRYCGDDIVFSVGPSGSDWRHLLSGELRCHDAQ